MGLHSRSRLPAVVACRASSSRAARTRRIAEHQFAHQLIGAFARTQEYSSRCASKFGYGLSTDHAAVGDHAHARDVEAPPQPVDHRDQGQAFFMPLTIAPTTAVTIAPVRPPPTNCPAKAPMSRPAPESAGMRALRIEPPPAPPSAPAIVLPSGPRFTYQARRSRRFCRAIGLTIYTALSPNRFKGFWRD
jgi:hypothetical protein